MSKSKGNVIYLDDLLKAAYTREEIRFFLIYGHYRVRLNFSYDNLKKASEKLKRVYEMIDSIQDADAGVQKSDDAVKELIEHLKQDFEKNMDDDLNVKQAFDDMLSALIQLTELAKLNRVTSEDAKRIITTLKSIDSVLQVFKLS